MRRQFTVLIESLIETRKLSFALFTKELAPLYGTRGSPLRFPRWRRFLVIARPTRLLKTIMGLLTRKFINRF